MLVFVGASIFFHAPEPSYQGKSLTTWIDDYAEAKGGGTAGNRHFFPVVKEETFHAAFEAMGTNCVPFIFRRLESEDSSLKTTYRLFWQKLPGFLGRILPAPKPLLEPFTAFNLLSYAGPAPFQFLMRELHSSSSTVREAAVEQIDASIHYGRTPVQAGLVIPEMIRLLKDSNASVRLYSADVLGDLGPKSSNAVPALILALHDNDLGPQPGSKIYVRAWAATALGKIGPVAAGAAPTLNQLMVGPDPRLRWKAAAAIWRIESNVESTLPVLLQELPASDEKWNLIDVLGEMGPRASNAIPALETEWKQADSYTRERITNAVLQIDPDAVAKLGIK
jgi:hypothetical protein